MIYLLMADFKLEDPTISDIEERFGVPAAPSNYHFYPECDMHRSEVGNFVERCLQLHSKHHYNQVILTDSDFVLNELRIAIREKKLESYNLKWIVVENSSLSFYHFDSDGCSKRYPKLENYHREQMRKLL